MLKSAYLLAKIGADTAENERHFAENLPTTLWVLTQRRPGWRTPRPTEAEGEAQWHVGPDRGAELAYVPARTFFISDSQIKRSVLKKQFLHQQFIKSKVVNFFNFRQLALGCIKTKSSS